MIIKLLLVAAMVAVALFALRDRSSSTSLAVRRLVGLGFVAVASLAIVFPDLVTWLAKLVGVGEGTNLVLYVLVVAFLFVVVGMYQRLHQLEQRLIDLARALALTQPLDGSAEQACERDDPAGPRRLAS